MPDGAFWSRTLRLFAGDQVELTFVAGDVDRRWRGRVAGLEDPLGPLVDIRGERRRLCRWEALRAVQAAPTTACATAAAMATTAIDPVVASATGHGGNAP
jgi:hypothetical protein